MPSKLIRYGTNLFKSLSYNFKHKTNYLLITTTSEKEFECKVCGENGFHEISNIPVDEINEMIEISFLFKGDPKLKELYDYSNGGGIRLCNCLGCNSLTTLETIPTDKIDEFYGYLYGTYDLYSGEKWEFSRVLNYLKKQDRGALLEFGGVNGNFFTKLLERTDYEVDDIIVYDFGEGNKELNIHPMDISKEVISSNDTYKYVISFNFLEHLQNYEAFFESLNSITNAESTIIISVPARYFPSIIFNNYSVLELPPHHVTHFSIDGMKKLFRNNGFDCFKVELEEENTNSIKYFYQILSNLFSYLAISRKKKDIIAKDFSKKSMICFFKKQTDFN